MNLFLLKDYDNGSIDAIIETEENDIFIQDNINKAKKELEEMRENETDGNICDFDYIIEYFDKYNIKAAFRKIDNYHDILEY